MKKIILILNFVFLFIVVGAIIQAQETKPQKVLRIVYETKPDEWYSEQAKLWKKVIDKNPKNAEAWHNYYNAVRYENFNQTIGTKEKQEKLQKIVADLGKHAPESFQYYYLKYFTSDDKTKNIRDMEIAHKMAPDRPDPLYELITHFELNGDEKKVTDYYQKLYESKDIAPWLVNYNYNVLMSTEENAIIFTNGDNDTYPARMLQEVKAVRTDVSILNISMSGTETYLERALGKKGIKINRKELMQKAVTIGSDKSKNFSISAFAQEVCKYLSENYPDFPVYFALTVYEQHFKPLKDNLYIVGLAYRYSPKRIDNIAVTKKNLENNFRLDYLQYDWYNDLYPGINLMNKMHLNYVPGMMILAEHYKTSGQQEQASYWKNMAKMLATRAGREDWIVDIEKNGL
ncbi:MAG TPA: hypothetical protein VGD14_26175 [bacterium]